MIFLFIVPGIPAILGNFILPLQLGADDVALPRLNLLSWYVYMAGAVMALTSLFAGGGAAGHGLDLLRALLPEHRHQRLAGGAGGLRAGLQLHHDGHELHHHDPPAARHGHGLLPDAAVLLGPVRHQLDPGHRHPGGGHHAAAGGHGAHAGHRLLRPGPRAAIPILYQHLFWIYSHPVVYVMVLPAMGIISEILPAFSRRTIFGYKAIAMSSMAIAVVGYLVWGHHMFTAGMSDTARWVFSLLTFLVAIPTGMKVFNWMATLYRGSIEIRVPLLYAVGWIFLFSIGGLTGLANGALSTDIHVHDTAFIVGHFHYTMFGGAAHRHVRRAALLVPQDLRPHVQREGGHLGLGPDHGRLQPAVLPHADPGHHGHAPPLPRLPAPVRTACTCCRPSGPGSW